MDFEHILETIGGFGPYQWYNSVLLGIPAILFGANFLASLFLSGLPNFKCDDQIEGNVTHLPDNNDVCVYNVDNVTKQAECTHWTYENTPFGNTAATEWNLVCNREWLIALTQSMFMLGFLIGSISFGNAADVFGRKKMYCISLMLIIVSGSLAAFMPTYWSFVLFRLLMGIMVGGAFTTSFVMTMEITGTEQRMKSGLLYQCWVSLGILALALAAYFIRNYVYLQLFLSSTCVLFVPYWWLIVESPRWQMVRGMTKKAVKEIKRAACMNKKPLPDYLQNDHSLYSNEKQQRESVRTYTLIDLVRTPNMRRKTMLSSLIWCALTLSFYGLSLSVDILPVGPHLNTFLTGLVEFPAFALAGATMNRFGRRTSLSAMSIASGILCLITIAIPSNYEVAISVTVMTAKFFITGCYCSINVYVSELYPTVVRNLGTGTGLMSSRLGGITSPFIMILRIWWARLPMLVMGCVAVIAGLLAMALPETLHQRLPETLEDGENYGTDVMTCWSACRKKRTTSDAQDTCNNTDITLESTAL